MFKFKKIASLFASALMVGSTVGLAAAANYPSPFVKTGGVSDVAVVYGAAAATGTDVVAAMDINADLSSRLIATSGSSGGTTTITGGDSVLIAKSSNNLNLGDNFSVFTGTVTKDNMPNLLADGTYRAHDNDEFDYEQKISLGTPATFSLFRDSDYESLVGLSEKTPTLGFKVNSNTYVLNYTLDFTSDAESVIANDDSLTDFENSDIPLFGKTYYVSSAVNGTNSAWLGKFILLDSSTTGSIDGVGNSVTVKVGNTSYDVTLTFASTSSAKFTINGEATNSLASGATYKLSDGAYLGVRDIAVNDYAGGTQNVEFSIGSGKLEITSGSEIKLNENTVSGVYGYIYRSAASDARIDKIVIQWKTDDKQFLTEKSDLKLPGFGNIKFTMPEIVRSEDEIIKVTNDGDNSMQLSVPIKEGTASIDFLYNNATSGNFTGIGKAADQRLATVAPGSNLVYTYRFNGDAQDEYFVASYNDSSAGESQLMRAKIATNNDRGRNETTIEKWTPSGWTEVCKDRAVNDACTIGQVSFTINAIAYTAGGNATVTLAPDTGVSFNKVFTDGGLTVYLPYVTANDTVAKGGINFTDVPINNDGHDAKNFYLFMTAEDKDDKIASGPTLNLTIDHTTSSNSPVQVSQYDNGGLSSGSEIGTSETYEFYLTADTAPKTIGYTSGDQDYAEVYYPTGNSEMYAKVYLASASASATSATNGTVTSAIGVPVTDTEAATLNKNLVVVGGSCINTIAAQLLGSSTTLCGAEFTTKTGVGAGQYLIQTFSRANQKIATLVAGYNSGDTQIAAKALTTQAVDTTVGKKYTGSTEANIAPAITS